MDRLVWIYFAFNVDNTVFIYINTTSYKILLRSLHYFVHSIVYCIIITQKIVLVLLDNKPVFGKKKRGLNPFFADRSITFKDLENEWRWERSDLDRSRPCQAKYQKWGSKLRSLAIQQ
jgi:hypothetical protein